MTGIAPGAYVRVTRGMYAGTQGRVAEVTDSGGSAGPWATIDHAALPDVRFAVYVSALELVGAVPTVEQERDAAIAERDEWKRRAEYAERELSFAFGLPATIGPAECEAKRIVDEGLAAIAERDQLRARVSDLEALSDATAVATEMDRLLARILDVQEDAARAQQGRDRLRRELEALRETLAANVPHYPAGAVSGATMIARLDAILRGDES